MSDKELFNSNLALFNKREEAAVFFGLAGSVIEKYNLSFLDERLNLSVAEQGQFRFSLSIGNKVVLEVKRSKLGLGVFFLLSKSMLPTYRENLNYLKDKPFKGRSDSHLVLVGFDLTTFDIDNYKKILGDWQKHLENHISGQHKTESYGHNLYFYGVITQNEKLTEALNEIDVEQYSLSFDREIEEEDKETKYEFNPQSVDIGVEQKSLDTLINRIRHNEIDLDTDFQRNLGLWSDKVMSLLIESILLNLPLPAFYFDASDDDKWIVVDGLQRLSTLQKFVVFADDRHESYKHRLKLKGLDILKDIKGLDYNQLPGRMKRRISEFSVTLYLIKPGTDRNVKYSIFHRINTGGLSLNPHEIRNALNQGGDAPRFLKELSENECFQRIVNISSKRMQDRELVLRFIAFQILSPEDYKSSMSQFLDSAMESLNENKTDYESLAEKFEQSLIFVEKIFQNHAFSKSIRSGNNIFNRTLFDVWMYYFSFLDVNQKEILLQRKNEVIDDFRKLLMNAKFDDSITFASATTANVVYRFTQVFKLIQKYLPDFNHLWRKQDNDQETTHQEL